MSESLREQLSAAFDRVVPATIPGDGATGAEPATIPEPKVDAPAAAAAEPPAKPAAPAAEPKADKDGRLRAGDGKFASAKAAEPAATVASSEPAKPRYARPSSWKAETAAVWDKLNRNELLTAQELDLFAQEAIRRDSEYARGVSTYKQEWDRAKPMIDAMAQFMPALQAANVSPAQWIQRLGVAEQMLTRGTPEQKLQAFVRLAEDARIPLQALFTKGQDGQWYLQPNAQLLAQQAQQQPAQPQITQADIDARVAAAMQARSTDESVRAFYAQKDKFPHAAEVRETMAGLLQAGLATTLEEAYTAALRHPRHAELYEAGERARAAAEEAKRAEDAKKAAQAARQKAVSPRTSTPTGVATAGDGKKDRRSTIAEAFESVVGGRV